MTSATSDSMARTTSPVEGLSSAIRASSRLRDSASAGKTSSASKAAVKRLPWPSLRARPTTAYGASSRGRARTAAGTAAVLMSESSAGVIGRSP
jgi:hypothetical protein